jgi:hypothetical protein
MAIEFEVIRIFPARKMKCQPRNGLGSLRHSLVDGGVVLPLNSTGLDDDPERAFGAFFEIWTLGLLFLVRGVCVGEFELALSQDFEAVVKVGSGSESLGSEAGAGVINLDEREALLGLVRDGGFDVRGVTAGKHKHGKQRERAEGKTHTGLSVTAGLSRGLKARQAKNEDERSRMRAVRTTPVRES